MNQALTMEQILDNEDRREATQLSVDDWVARARLAEADKAKLVGIVIDAAGMGCKMDWARECGRCLYCRARAVLKEVE